MVQRHGSATHYEEQIGFSRAVRTGDRILVAGTAPIGRDGKTAEGDAYAQACRCFEIIVEAIEALGGNRNDVVRTRMYLCDAADWEAVGRAHGEFFHEAKPTATMLVVAGLLDPAWRVEIEAEAFVRAV